MLGQLAHNRLEGGHVLTVRLRTVVAPRERPAHAALDQLAVLLNQAKQLRLRDRLGFDLEFPAGGYHEHVELIGRREVLNGQRVLGQPVGELGEGLGVNGLLIDELTLVLRVPLEEAPDLGQVFGLGLRQVRGEAADRLGLLLL